MFSDSRNCDYWAMLVLGTVTLGPCMVGILAARQHDDPCVVTSYLKIALVALAMAYETFAMRIIDTARFLSA